jgi:hypothetical protein
VTSTRTRGGRKFWLVQRLAEPFTRDPGRGFDGFFSCEYMGSAEFEWGAIPESLKRLRERRQFLQRSEIQIDAARTMYLIHDSANTTVVDDFLDWFTAPEQYPGAGPRAKENTYLSDVLHSEDLPDWRRDSVRTIAWWSLTDDVLFALDQDVAMRLMAAIDTKAKR